MNKQQLINKTIELLCDGDENSSFRKYFTIETLEKFVCKHNGSYKFNYDGQEYHWCPNCQDDV